MSETRLKILLTEAEYHGLVEIAALELRSPADQVRFLLRRELDRRGIYEPTGDPHALAAAPAIGATVPALKGW